MKFIIRDFLRFSLVMLSLCSVVLGWSFPNTSCACAKAQFTSFINIKSDNQESFSCSFCKDSQICSCCLTNEQYFDLNTYTAFLGGIFDATRCQCELHTNGLPSSKMIVSETKNSRSFKQQLNNDAYTFSFRTITNIDLSQNHINDYFKARDSISFTLLYCQLNI